jgi:hypothetical protein
MQYQHDAQKDLSGRGDKATLAVETPLDIPEMGNITYQPTMMYVYV